MDVLALAALVALGGIAFLVSVLLWVLLTIFLEKFRLSTAGGRTRGVCAGYTSGRHGNGIMVDFTDSTGTANRMVATGWRGVLPDKGGEVESVYPSRDPKAAGGRPVRSLIPNAIYMAVPLILACGIA